MLKKTLLAAAILGLTSASLTATANEQMNGYLFGSVGQSDADLSKSSLDAFYGVTPPAITSSLDETDTAFKVGAGIQLNQHFAVEFQYTDLGTATYKATDGITNLRLTAETTGLGASVVGTIPLDRLSLFGKLGYHQMKTKVRESFHGFSNSDSEKEWVTGMGLGVAFSVNHDFDVVAEYERYRKVADDYDVDMWSVGLRYKF